MKSAMSDTQCNPIFSILDKYIHLVVLSGVVVKLKVLFCLIQYSSDWQLFNFHYLQNWLQQALTILYVEKIFVSCRGFWSLWLATASCIFVKSCMFSILSFDVWLLHHPTALSNHSFTPREALQKVWSFSTSCKKSTNQTKVSPR